MSIFLIPEIVNTLKLTPSNVTNNLKLKQLRLDQVYNAKKQTKEFSTEFAALTAEYETNLASYYYDLIMFLKSSVGLHTSVVKDGNDLRVGLGFNLSKPGAKSICLKLGIDYDKLVKNEAELTYNQVGLLLNESLFMALNKMYNFLPRPSLEELHPHAKLGLAGIAIAINLNKQTLTNFVKIKDLVLKKDFAGAAGELQIVKPLTLKNNKAEIIASLFS